MAEIRSHPKDHSLTHEENRAIICLMCLQKRKKMYTVCDKLKETHTIQLSNNVLPSALCCNCKIKVHCASKENKILLLPNYEGFTGEMIKTRSNDNSKPCLCKLCELARSTSSWNFGTNSRPRKEAGILKETHLQILFCHTTQRQRTQLLYYYYSCEKYRESNENVELMLSQGSSLSTSSGEIFIPYNAGPSQSNKSRGSYNIFSERVVATFDRCKISDRDAVFLSIAICQSLIDINLLNVSIDSLIINRSSIRRYRQSLRESKSNEIKKHFQDLKLSSIVVHWDGKLLPNLLNTQTVHRLPVIITSEDKEILLGVPVTDDGTGLAQANRVYETLLDWGFDTCVKAICCDTTPSNLAIRNGAAALLERFLDKDLLYLPCRHHIFEIVLRYVFEAVFPNTSGPNVPLFVSFQKKWNTLDQLNYKTGVNDPKLKIILTDDKINSIRTFATEFLTMKLPRNDYKEFLELTLVFIGIIPKNFCFRKPGACHHARWMAKAIYVLKIYLFREQLSLKKGEEGKLREICFFITTVYMKAWFLSTNGIKAPYHDLQFMKELNNFKVINSHLATVAINKFMNHLWYLSPELSVIAIFYQDISIETKLKIVSRTKQEQQSSVDTISEEDYTGEKCSVKRYQNKNINDLLYNDIDFFVTAESIKFFERFELRTEFLQIHPSKWAEDESYIIASKFVKTLSVVNDCAERGVKLVQDFSRYYTKDKKQLQYVLQLVKDHRERFPDSLKKTNM
ncbi:unnamed protein product [Brassicogethes aeneus]|uniref:Uncharacterized protein n=1 Tax=Brassicogethes aeneus TaxID=1431903 RepID=A0A9P0AS74_BRAAE|nr:unnamed protein product [Brassicogethes aeneus]